MVGPGLEAMGWHLLVPAAKLSKKPVRFLFLML